jgi:hypothetical protein
MILLQCIVCYHDYSRLGFTPASHDLFITHRIQYDIDLSSDQSIS